MEKGVLMTFACQSRTKYHVAIRHLPLWGCLLLFAVNLGTEAVAQKTRKNAPATTDDKKGKPGSRVKEEEKKTGPTMLIRVPVEPNKGYLAIATTRGSMITYRALAKPNLPKISVPTDSQGLRGFPLKPGKYHFEITRADYETFSREIEIRKGEQKPLPAYLSPKYGAVILNLTEKAVLPLKVELNGKPVEETRLRVADNRIQINRVDLGLQEFRLLMPGYKLQSVEHVVQPGECDNLISVKLAAVTLALLIETKPNAQVALSDGRTWPVPADGKLPIPDLKPGEVRFTVSMPGFVSQVRVLTLTEQKLEYQERVDLPPSTELAAIEVAQPPEAKEWKPTVPAEWAFSISKPMGMIIKGDTPALLYKTTAPNRTINQYGDFELTLSVKFSNGKGAAWIVRAQDPRNYYLFELTTAASTLGRKRLVFYVCRDGKLEKILEHPVPHVLEEPNRSYTIKLRAVGERFQHYIVTPAGAVRELCAPIDDNDKTFAFGGIGLRAINGLVMSIEQFTIEPQKP
jgi:hypothetical protein